MSRDTLAIGRPNRTAPADRSGDSASVDSGWRAESICALEWVHRESENADPVDNVAKPPYLDAACSSKPLFVHAGDAVE